MRHLFSTTLLTLCLATSSLSLAQQSTPPQPNRPVGPAGGQPNGNGSGEEKIAMPVADAADLDVVQDANVPAIRVNSTNQSYNFLRPWDKGSPFTRRGMGAVIEGNRILVTAELIANNTFIELERPSSGERVPASVDKVDYEANLAILKPQDPSILNGITPLQFTNDAKAGDKVTAWQFEETGILIKTEGLLTSVQMGGYPLEGSDLLLFKITIALQPRDGSFTVPVLKEGKIAGVLMRYDPRSQNADAIASSVLAHFLKDASSSESYKGFPKAGISFTATRDPQLRRYAKIPNGDQGVYVTDVFKGGPADKAGIQRGDVLTKIDGVQIDADGNYQDPQFGRLNLSNLTAQKFPGDTSKFSILREGKPMDVELVLERREPDDFSIPPYTIDKGPEYCVIGGIVFQELSRQYLRSWGGDWVNRAPRKLVYYDRFQTELLKDPKKRVVILSQVLPTPVTIGYEGHTNLIVTKINGMEVFDIASTKEAFKHPKDGFHLIETLDDPRLIHLDAKEMEENEEQVHKAYGIPKS